MNPSSLKRIKKGVQDPHKALNYLQSQIPPYLSGIEAAVFSRNPIGDNILDENWDLLLILDTCRLDALKEIRQTKKFIFFDDMKIESRYSVGGSTLEWTAQTFGKEERRRMKNIDYIAGNVLVEEVLDGRRSPESVDNAAWSPTKWDIASKSDFNKFISVGEMRDVRGPATGHRDRPHPSAQLVTDLAIKHGRKHSPNQLIVHYIQPHYPYYNVVKSGEREEMTEWEKFPFAPLRYGKVSKKAVWERYMSELYSGVEAIDTLLQNYSADRVIITSDHGEAFGERYFGIRGYKHRVGMLHPKVRRVPWAITSATDTKKRIPDVDLESSSQSREEILKSLGYL